MKNRKLTINLYSLLIFFYLMLGSHAWFVWPLEDSEKTLSMRIVLIVCAFFNYIYISYDNILLNKNKNVVFGLSFLFLAYFMQSSMGFFSIILDTLFIFSLWTLLSVKKIYESVISNIIRWLSIILILGIILHVFFLIYGAFPGIPIYHPNNNYYYFYNYLILVKGLAYGEDGLRFQSIFLEPGYLGVLMSFLLYTIKYDFSKYKTAWILLLALILSFSLAGYLICGFGFIFCQWANKNKLTHVMTFSVLMILVIIAAKSYNNGRNYVNELIIERFAPDKEKGISGNNRFSDAAIYYFDKSISDGSILWGLGPEKINKINGGNGWVNANDNRDQIRGAGFVLFFLYYGLSTAMFYLMAYCFLGMNGTRNKRYVWGYLFLIVMTFLQTSYPASYSWLIPFIIGVNMIDYLPKRNRINSHRALVNRSGV